MLRAESLIVVVSDVAVDEERLTGKLCEILYLSTVFQ
jgi:hypothetical protein